MFDASARRVVAPEVIKLSRLITPLRTVQLAVKKLLIDFPFRSENQLNLTSSAEGEGDPYSGLGAFFDTQLQQLTDSDARYTFDTPCIKGTALGELMTEIRQTASAPIGRTRLMRLPPKRCYSFHKDDCPRLHYVIATNPQCFMIFVTPEVYGNTFLMPPHQELSTKYVHLPSDNSLYFTDTSRYHSAQNAGTSDRLHIVASVCRI